MVDKSPPAILHLVTSFMGTGTARQAVLELQELLLPS